MKQRALRKERGFTVMELLILLIILALLVSLVGPKFFGTKEKARQKTAKTQIEMLMVAMEAFRVDVGRYPTQQEGLAALAADPGVKKWDGAYLKMAVPNDPWGNPYRYRNPGEHGPVDIYSYGRDNQPGGEKESTDIGSWE